MRCKNVMQSKNTSIELYKIILNTYLYAHTCHCRRPGENEVSQFTTPSATKIFADRKRFGRLQFIQQQLLSPQECRNRMFGILFFTFFAQSLTTENQCIPNASQFFLKKNDRKRVTFSPLVRLHYREPQHEHHRFSQRSASAKG